MSVLYSLIHERGLSTWKDEPVTGDNLDLWAKHWFETAHALEKDMLKEGLADTAQAINNIIQEQRRFFPEEK